MPKFAVTIGYEWTTSHFREIEITAANAKAAKVAALQRASDELDFWQLAVDCDGEASATKVYEVRHERAV